MAMHFTRASLQGLSRASAPDYNSPYTVLGLVRLTTLLPASGNAAQVITVESGAPGDSFDILQLTNPVSNTLIGLVVGPGTGPITVTGATVLATATWYFVALVRRSTVLCEAYLGTSPSGVALECTNTTSVTGRSSASNALHLAEFFGNDLDGDMRAWRAYTSALSLDQLKAEALRFTPFLTGAWGSWPLANATDLADTSGNARDFTVLNGPATLSTEPPTPPWNGPFTMFARLER